jgi:hypothetical protein
MKAAPHLLARRRSRGAALFAVTAMLAVLAGLGAFAVASVLSDVRTGASLRQRAQARFVADIALANTLGQLRPDNAYLIVQPMLDTTRSDHRDATNRCFSLTGVPLDGTASALSRACARRYVSDFLNASQRTELGGAYGDGIGWDYLVEITEPTELQGSVGSSSTVPVCDLSLTVSAYGRTGPRNGAGLATPVVPSMNVQLERVRFVIPGVPCSR